MNNRNDFLEKIRNRRYKTAQLVDGRFVSILDSWTEHTAKYGTVVMLETNLGFFTEFSVIEDSYCL